MFGKTLWFRDFLKLYLRIRNTIFLAANWLKNVDLLRKRTTFKRNPQLKASTVWNLLLKCLSCTEQDGALLSKHHDSTARPRYNIFYHKEPALL